jgi:hypothetical protein
MSNPLFHAQYDAGKDKVNFNLKWNCIQQLNLE